MCLILTALASNAERRQSICEGEVVVFTCEVWGSGVLRWGINPYVDIDHNPIRFRLRDNLAVGYTVKGTGGLYNATVLYVSVDPMNTLLGDITSELRILAVSGQRVEVQCDDGISENRLTAVMPRAGRDKLYTHCTYM